MFPKIDFHAHILPESWPNLKEKFGYGGWIYMDHRNDGKTNMMKDDGTVFRPVNSKLWSPNDRLIDMDKTGVTMQVLSTVPVMFSYWAKPEDTTELCRILNDHLASVITEYPKRFTGIGTVPMQSPTLAIEEMKRCKYELKLNGIMIGSHVNDYNLNDKQFDKIWKTAEDLNIPIFVHPWDMPNIRMSKYWFPHLIGMPSETSMAILSMIFGGVFERFPQLKVCYAHGGGAFPYIIGRAEHAFHVYPNDVQIDNTFPPSKYLGRNIYADTLVHTKDSLDLAIKVFGEDYLILGSDYPFLLGEHNPGAFIEKEYYNNNAKQKFLYKNAIEFLGIENNI